MDVVLDQFGDFGLDDIASMVFSMIAASVIVFLLGFALKKKKRSGIFNDMTLSALVAAAVRVVMGSLPLAAAFVAIILAARIFVEPKYFSKNGLFTFIALIIGLICGARAVMVAIVVAIPLFLLLSIASRRDS